MTDAAQTARPLWHVVGFLVRFMMMPPTQDAHVHAPPAKDNLGDRREQDEDMSPEELRFRRKERETRRSELLDAIHAIARRSPEVFEAEAEDLIRRSVWQQTGSDPMFSSKLDRWLKSEYRFETFASILPHDARLERREVEPPSVEHLDARHRQVYDALIEKFDGTKEQPRIHHRWDAATRDQFIILGMIALGGKHGERQSRMVHYLGLGASGSDHLRGSNTVRAAKIALTRHLRSRVPGFTDLFSKATGNGDRRQHRFKDLDVASTVAQYVRSHPASMLLPEPPLTA